VLHGTVSVGGMAVLHGTVSVGGMAVLHGTVSVRGMAVLHGTRPLRHSLLFPTEDKNSHFSFCMTECFS
jgi:hypothetical protein